MNRDRLRAAPIAIATVRLASFAPDLVLVVVIPRGINTEAEHLLFDTVLPPLAVGWACEVEMRTPAVPELVEAGLAGRLLRVLIELELLDFDKTSLTATVPVVGKTSLDRSQAFVYYEKRYEEGKQYLEKLTAEAVAKAA